MDQDLLHATMRKVPDALWYRGCCAKRVAIVGGDRSWIVRNQTNAVLVQFDQDTDALYITNLRTTRVIKLDGDRIYPYFEIMDKIASAYFENALDLCPF